jgi:hypothetical protein
MFLTTPQRQGIVIPSNALYSQKNGASWDRTGPPALLVSVQSATCRLDQRKSNLIFPINQDHSDMVKFPKYHRYTKIVCQKLAQICNADISDATLPLPDLEGVNTGVDYLPPRASHLRKQMRKMDCIGRSKQLLDLSTGILAGGLTSDCV